MFAVNLLLKMSHATVAYTFLVKCLHHMLVKFEQNAMVQTELFDLQKKSLSKPFLTKD